MGRGTFRTFIWALKNVKYKFGYFSYFPIWEFFFLRKLFMVDFDRIHYYRNVSFFRVFHATNDSGAVTDSLSWGILGKFTLKNENLPVTHVFFIIIIISSLNKGNICLFSCNLITSLSQGQNLKTRCLNRDTFLFPWTVMWYDTRFPLMEFTHTCTTT